MPMTLLIPLVAIVALAIVLLIWGLRGRRVDDHPLCRRCRYDLCGSASIPKICPECGRALTAPQSVRFGHRQKRRVALVIAVFILVGSLGGGGLVGWRNSQDYDWNRAKPMWWLKLDASSDDMKRSAVALDELLRRLIDRTLRDGQTEDLVEVALDVQGDVSIAWNPTWGDVIEQAWVQQFVDEEQLALYLRQMIEPAVTLQTRKRMRENGFLRYLVAHNQLRASSQSAFKVMQITDSIELGDYRRAETGLTFASSGGASGSGVSIEIGPGVHELRMGLRFLLMTIEEQLAEFDMVLTSTIVVVPADQPTVELIDEPTLPEAVRASLSIDSIRVSRASGGEARIRAHVRALGPPIDVAFMISARIGDKEIPLEPFVAAARIGDHTLVSGRGRIDEAPAIPPNLTHIDFVFRPNAEIAEEQFAGFDRIYGGPEIVIENVPVEIVRQNEGE